ncbi:MAG: hypothetical protein H7249_14535 [Chitinophagaceae bacterium]|nr:hypothetical protein [Oligoflexus sp.]
MSDQKPIVPGAAPTTPTPATSIAAPVRKMKEGWVSKLETLILGRERRDEVIDDSVTPGTTVDIVFIPTIQGLVTFKVRADTSCKAVQELLTANAQPGVKLEVIPGPRGGLRLGVNGKFNPKLNLFVKK